MTRIDDDSQQYPSDWDRDNLTPKKQELPMTERTVTEKQVRDALAFSSQTTIAIDERILNRLFPELPKVGELVLVWDEIPEGADWQTVISISGNEIKTLSFDGEHYKSCNYRRQTPAEKGEG